MKKRYQAASAIDFSKLSPELMIDHLSLYKTEFDFSGILDLLKKDKEEKYNKLTPRFIK